MGSGTVQVRTLPRTMSGYRGNLVLTLEREVAREWIARRWAVPVEEPKKKNGERRDERT